MPTYTFPGSILFCSSYVILPDPTQSYVFPLPHHQPRSAQVPLPAPFSLLILLTRRLLLTVFGYFSMTIPASSTAPGKSFGGAGSPSSFPPSSFPPSSMLYYLPILHMYYPITHLGEFFIVGNDQKSLVEFLS